ncbi:MAG: hypothetical protein KC419_19365 [Anaerolineales bacterium]|nr:hypothetical protein [Anaerolineales bacterium]
MPTKNRLTRQYLWGQTSLSLFIAIAALNLATSCMFVTAGFFSQSNFLFFTPLLSVTIMIVGAWQETKPLPRALALVIGWLILLGTFALAAIGIAQKGGSLTSTLSAGGAMTLILAGLIGFYGLKTVRAYRNALSAGAEQLLVDLVQIRGEVTLAEAAEELRSSASDAAHIAEQAVASGALAGAVDLPNQRIYSLTMLAQKQAQLASVVQAQGQITMPDLSRELRAPESLIRQWLYQLVRRGRFSGYVNWESDTIYSQEREELQQRHTCPNCAAPLELVGQGIIGCTFCGAEIFV